jgi:hypothetical protein
MIHQHLKFIPKYLLPASMAKRTQPLKRPRPQGDGKSAKKNVSNLLPHSAHAYFPVRSKIR